MKKFIPLILIPALLSCTNRPSEQEKEIVDVTVPKQVQATVELKTKKVKSITVDARHVISLNTQVTFESVSLVMQRLNELRNSEQPVYLLLDSPGGSVFDGNLLISYIEGSHLTINTVATGLCASMCAQIFSHGTTRYMVDRSILMFHQASGGISGNMKGMKNLLEFIDREVRKDDAYVAKRAGMTAEAFDTLVSNDLWLAADDAVEKHLADSLVHVTLAQEKSLYDITAELKKRNIPIGHFTTKNPLTEIY